MYFRLTIVVALAVGAVVSAAQQLQATRFDVTGPAWNGTSGALIGTKEINPLVIATTSPSAQPIRFFTGSHGSLRVLEVGPTGELWSRGPLSVGAATTTQFGEMMRISTVAPSGGTGLSIDLQGSLANSGLRVLNVGLSGTEEAGVVISGQSNGVGTAIRIGGPTGAMRPTLSTGIDITGGTGLRYNALSSGDGTAISIGSTSAPRRGIEVTTTGSGHVGVLSVANSAGTALLGAAQSASYAAPSPVSGVGVMGIGASNSNGSADTVVGVLGRALRGGRGGTRTTTIGIRTAANSIGEDHAGTAIGMLASAVAASPGVSAAIGGAFQSQPDHMAIVAAEGDIYLGSDVTERPPILERSTMSINGRSTTHLFRSMQSGPHHVVNAVNVVVAPGQVNDLDIGAASFIRLQCGVGNIELTGLAGAVRGRFVTIVNTACPLTVINESAMSLAAHRIRTAGQGNMVAPIDGVFTLWYDEEIARWRVVSCSW